MYSLAFPQMFSNGVRTNLLKDHDATLNNLRLLLNSDRTSLYGDPYYGTALKRMLYEQNNLILKDLIIDEIYTTIITFMPQILISRNDIKVTSDGLNVYTELKCTDLIDYTTNMYTIKLTDDAE